VVARPAKESKLLATGMVGESPKEEGATLMAEWTHEQLLELCDVANGLTPDEMRRQIVWFALMSERKEQG